MSHIRVLLAEDQVMIREALRTFLELEKDMHVVGEAGDGRKAVALCLQLHPDVVVLDLAMPLLNGIEATRQILHACPGTKIIILSVHSDEAYVERVLSLGASGYLIKQSAAEILPKAIRTVLKGGEFFSAPISRQRKRHAQDEFMTGGTAKPKTLTPRESEVLQLVAEGQANKQIAAELGISIKTVEKHRQSLMEKLGIHDTAGLTRYAMATGAIVYESVLLRPGVPGGGRTTRRAQR
jgi:DNA-binding NarL/FixJ family response regulator